MRVFQTIGAGMALSSLPGLAIAAPRLTLANVFGDAAPTMQGLMILLIGAALAAIVLTVFKVASGRPLAGGSAFVSALRLGGPLLGLMGATFVILMSFLALANLGRPVPMPVLAPGFAEAALLFLLGLFAGVVGVICHWVIEARIDRAVLKS